MHNGQHTLAQPAEGLYKEKGSRFIAYLMPAATRAEVEAGLATVRQRHPDARHICYAWRLGADEAANDAGEPAHSAGAPILRVLKAAGITHGLAVVVRYFGGTKLGIPGLIHAYATAAEDALQHTAVVPYVPMATATLRYTYAQTSLAERLIRQFQLTILQAEYGIPCLYTLRIPMAVLPEFSQMAASAGLDLSVDD